MFHFLQKINSQLQKLRVMFDNLPTTMLEEVGHFIYVPTYEYYEVYRKNFKVNFQ